MSEEIKESVATDEAVKEQAAEVKAEVAQDAAEVETVAETAAPVAAEVVAEPVVEAEPVKAKPEPVKEKVKPVKVKTAPVVAVVSKPVKVKTENSAVRNDRKTRIGIVVSDKMNKTIVVAVKSRAKHHLYKKTISSTTKFKAHDEKQECGIGDTVEIAETRHISKDKYFRLVRIVEKAK